MKNSKRESITHIEYIQLSGLLVLSAQHQRDLRAIEQAVLSITQETDYHGELMGVWEGGHCGDAVADTNPDTSELLKKLGLSVEPPDATRTNSVGTDVEPPDVGGAIKS